MPAGKMEYHEQPPSSLRDEMRGEGAILGSMRACEHTDHCICIQAYEICERIPNFVFFRRPRRTLSLNDVLPGAWVLGLRVGLTN